MTSSHGYLIRAGFWKLRSGVFLRRGVWEGWVLNLSMRSGFLKVWFSWEHVFNLSWRSWVRFKELFQKVNFFGHHTWILSLHSTKRWFFMKFSFWNLWLTDWNWVQVEVWLTCELRRVNLRVELSSRWKVSKSMKRVIESGVFRQKRVEF